MTGAPAYDAEASSAVLAKIIADPPSPIRSTRPEVPAALEKVILRCLKKEASDRYRGVAELSKALLPFAADDALTLVDRIDRIAKTAASIDPDPDAPRQRRHWRSRTKHVAAAALALFAAIVGTKLLKRTSGASPAEAPKEPTENRREMAFPILEPPIRELAAAEPKLAESVAPVPVERLPTATGARKIGQPAHGNTRDQHKSGSHPLSAAPSPTSEAPDGLGDRK